MNRTQRRCEAPSGRLGALDAAALRPLVCLAAPTALLLVGVATVRTLSDLRAPRHSPVAVSVNRSDRVAVFAPYMERRLHRLRRESLVEGDARLSTAEIDVLINWTQEMRGGSGAEPVDLPDATHVTDQRP